MTRPWRSNAPRCAAVPAEAATETKTGQGRLMVQPTPDEAAAAIYDCLVQQGVIR